MLHSNVLRDKVSIMAVCISAKDVKVKEEDKMIQPRNCSQGKSSTNLSEKKKAKLY